MRILGLDISSKTGWAIVEDKRLLEYGLLSVEIQDFNVQNFPTKSPYYPYNLVYAANDMAVQILDLVNSKKVDHIIIEDTVKGRNRSTQRLLEFIHKAVLDNLIDYKKQLIYRDPSEWRKILNVKLSNEDKKNNKLVSKGQKRGRIGKKHLSIRQVKELYGLNLKMKQNNESDAILLATSEFYK